MKVHLHRMEEERVKVRSASVEQKFSVRHSEDVIHEYIDLIGYNKKEAIDLTERRIRITQ